MRRTKVMKAFAVVGTVAAVAAVAVLGAGSAEHSGIRRFLQSTPIGEFERGEFQKFIQ